MQGSCKANGLCPNPALPKFWCANQTNHFRASLACRTQFSRVMVCIPRSEHSVANDDKDRSHLVPRHQPTKPGSGPRTAEHVASPRVTRYLCRCSIFCDQNLITKYTIRISFNYLGCCWLYGSCPVYTSACLPRGKNPFRVLVSSDKMNPNSLLSSTELMLNLKSV